MQNARSLAATIHGMSRSRPYRIWRSMKSRCEGKAERSKWYAELNYDPRWSDFFCFWQDMKDGYADHLTLDRINTKRGYSKDNCRWATVQQQMRNRKDNIFLPYENEMLCVSDFAKKVGVKRALLYQRIKRGVLINELTKPSRKGLQYENLC